MVRSDVPQFYFAVVACRCDHLVERMVAHAEDWACVIDVILVGFCHSDEVFFACFSIPGNYAAILGDREYFIFGCLYSCDALSVALVGDRFRHFHITKVRLLIDKQLILTPQLELQKILHTNSSTFPLTPLHLLPSCHPIPHPPSLYPSP